MRSKLIPLVAAVLLAGCDKTEKVFLRLSEVKTFLCGSYEGRYNRGWERFVFRSDGSFSQEFKRDDRTVYRSDGRWELTPVRDQNDRGHYCLRLTPFMDSTDAILGRGQIQKVASYSAHFYDNEPVVWLFRDVDYYVTKEEETEPNQTSQPTPVNRRG